MPSVYAWGPGGDAGTELNGSHSGGGGGSGSLGGEPQLGGVLAGTVLTVTIPAGSGSAATITGGSVTVTGNTGGNGSGQTAGAAGTAPANTLSQAGAAGGGGLAGTNHGGGSGAGAPGLTAALAAAAGTAGSVGGAGANPGGPGGGAAPYAGGTGGTGGAPLGNGSDGAAPGAGGGGPGDNGAGHAIGNGARGQALIIWTVFVPAGSSSRGAASARRGRSASSPGAPVIIIPPITTPAPFAPPRRAPRGSAAAVRGDSASSPGAPVSPTPAPFAPPRRAPRGAPGARRGRTSSGSSSRGAPVIAPPAAKTLLISLASAAGTDDYGTAYPQGIFAAAGVIEGPQFVGADFIINSAGTFIYGGTPAAGNLIASIANAAGTDSFGNPYQAGFTVYGAGTSFAQLLSGFLNFKATAAQSSPAYAATAGLAGLLELSSGQVTGGDAPALIDLLSQAASGAGHSQLNINADETIFNGNLTATSSTINIPSGAINLNMAVPTGYPLNTATATTAQIATCLNALITSMINRALIT